MSYIIDRDGIFECRKSEQGPDAGNGIFCLEDVKGGTILPYYAVAFEEEIEYETDSSSGSGSGSDSDSDSDMEVEEKPSRDRTYTMSAEYCSKNGNPGVMKEYAMDGNPSLQQLKDVQTFKTLAAQINEASMGYKPNCMFATNSSIRRKDIKNSFKDQVPIPVIYVVVPYDLPSGTELLTSYGRSYGERAYTPCKMKRKDYSEMIDECYRLVELLDEQD